MSISGQHSQQLEAECTDPDPVKGIRVGHQQLPLQMGDRCPARSIPPGDFSNRTSLPTRDTCELRMSTRNQSEKEWISSLLLGFSPNITKAAKVRVHIPGRHGCPGLAALLEPAAPAGLASAPRAPTQRALQPLSSLEERWV